MWTTYVWCRPVLRLTVYEIGANIFQNFVVRLLKIVNNLFPDYLQTRWHSAAESNWQLRMGGPMVFSSYGILKLLPNLWKIAKNNRLVVSKFKTAGEETVTTCACCKNFTAIRRAVTETIDLQVFVSFSDRFRYTIFSDLKKSTKISRLCQLRQICWQRSPRRGLSAGGFSGVIPSPQGSCGGRNFQLFPSSITIVLANSEGWNSASW